MTPLSASGHVKTSDLDAKTASKDAFFGNCWILFHLTLHLHDFHSTKSTVARSRPGTHAYNTDVQFPGATVSMQASMPHPILFYDGVCGLCNRFVQFVLRRDRNDLFRFAALQSSIAARILSRHGINPGALDTVYVVVNHDLPDERIFSRSDAVLFVLNQLKSPWRQTAFWLGLVPRFVRDWAYNAIAQHRYRIFGRSEICMLPSDQDHSRFLDG